MTINRNNFEEYLLDYLEGNPDPLLTAELMAFLAENPEYESFLPERDLKTLTPNISTYDNKSRLKRDFSDIPAVNASNFDEFCIALYEGMLRPEDQQRLQDYIMINPASGKDLDLYRQLKLKPDMSVVYQQKNALKKPAGRASGVRYLYFALSLAASLIFILLLVFRNKPAAEQLAQSREIEILVPQPQNKIPVLHVLAAIKPEHKDNTHLETLPPAESQTGSDKPEQRDYFVPASLDPLTKSLPDQAGLPSVEALRTLKPFNNNQPAIQKGILKDILNSDHLLQAIVSHIDFWKTAEKAIEGINYLTETQLSISRTVDENGNLSLLLNTESYSIEGNKVK